MSRVTVEEKTDGTQVWTAPEGDYVFVSLSTLNPGDRLEADHRRPQPQVLTRPDLDDFATVGGAPSTIYVRVRNATDADRRKPKKDKP